MSFSTKANIMVEYDARTVLRCQHCRKIAKSGSQLEITIAIVVRVWCRFWGSKKFLFVPDTLPKKGGFINSLRLAKVQPINYLG